MSIEVTFSNTSTDLLATCMKTKKFHNTELCCINIVNLRLKSDISVLVITKKILLNQDFDCSKWPSSFNIRPDASKMAIIISY